MTDDARPLKDRHLTRRDLRRFLERKQTLEQDNELLLHHLAVCPQCAATGGWLVSLFEVGALEGLSFGIVEVELAALRAQAPALWEKLRHFSFERQKGLVRDAKRFHSWGLCELLCHESVRLAVVDAARAVEGAELAVLVGSLVEEDRPAERLWLLQLRAYAWAHLGNARRVQGDLRSAEEAFACSDTLWSDAASMGNVLDYEARLLDLKASLRRTQRRLPEALELLERALQSDAEEGSPDKARLLINKAKTLEETGDFDQAIELLQEAGALLEPTGDCRLKLCVRQNLLWVLATAGRHGQAEELLPEVVRLSRGLANPLDRVRLRWAEGRVAAGLGKTEQAVALLEEVRREFVSLCIGYDAALVSLELASLFAGQGRAAEVKALAREMLPVFQAQEVHRESLAALAFFLQAAERETVTADLAARLAAFLRRARHTPGLRFEVEEA